MNKIVREHYPVSSLPEDLRQDLDPKTYVRIVIEELDMSPKRTDHWRICWLTPDSWHRSAMIPSLGLGGCGMNGKD